MSCMMIPLVANGRDVEDMQHLDATDFEGKGDDSNVLVGVNYFAGWWKKQPNKWQHGEQDWRLIYPERRPLLGEYNTQETMDREIVAAADHGVDFFQILWYGAEKERENDHLLNRGVEQFMRSPNAGRMKFMIEYCNHKPFGITSETRWLECVSFWVKCMQHPSYLRVGGRSVFKIHGGGQFYVQTGGPDGNMDRFLIILRDAVREADVGELIIGSGGNGPMPFRDDHWMLTRLDYNNEYMAVPRIKRTGTRTILTKCSPSTMQNGVRATPRMRFPLCPRSRQVGTHARGKTISSHVSHSRQERSGRRPCGNLRMSSPRAYMAFRWSGVVCSPPSRFMPGTSSVKGGLLRRRRETVT